MNLHCLQGPFLPMGLFMTAMTPVSNLPAGQIRRLRAAERSAAPSLAGAVSVSRLQTRNTILRHRHRTKPGAPIRGVGTGGCAVQRTSNDHLQYRPSRGIAWLKGTASHASHQNDTPVIYV